KWKETDTLATRLTRLEAAMKEVERRINDGVEQGTARMPVGQRADAFAKSGLPRRGIELILEAGDKAKGQAIGRPDMLKLVELLQRVGRLEEAAVYRRTLEADLANTSDPTGQFAALQLARQALEFNEASLAGDYRRADVLLEQVWKSQTPSPMTDYQKKVTVANPVAFPAAVGVAAALPVTTTAAALRQQLLFESVYWCRRGLFALYDGDAARAKQMFDAAAEPQGVKLSELGGAREIELLTVFLPRYRALLDKYATK
ncbi:MAG: hypothetical protein ABGY75_07935, partial [Gemmataceae bacterium]